MKHEPSKPNPPLPQPQPGQPHPGATPSPPGQPGSGLPEDTPGVKEDVHRMGQSYRRRRHRRLVNYFSVVGMGFISCRRRENRNWSCYLDAYFSLAYT